MESRLEADILSISSLPYFVARAYMRRLRWTFISRSMVVWAVLVRTRMFGINLTVIFMFPSPNIIDV